MLTGKFTFSSKQDLEKMFSELRFEPPPLAARASNVCFHGLKVGELNPVEKIIITEEEVGKGVFNHVYKGRCKLNMCDLAVKKVNCRSAIGQKFLDQELRNYRILMENPHDNIIEFYGCCDHERHRYFVFELGQLSFEKFLELYNEEFTVGHFNEIAYQILEAQAHLKRINIKHNDVKFKNMVFFKNDRKIKLIDFERALVPGDPRFSSTRSVLPFLGKSLGELQATIKNPDAVRTESAKIAFSNAYEKACKNEFSKNDFDLLISDVNIWNPSLQESTKTGICLCFLAYTSEGENDALEYRTSLLPRESLKFA